LEKMNKLSILSKEVVSLSGVVSVIMSDKYEKGTYIPLGFRVMQVFIDSGFNLKSIIVKNFGDTSAKRQRENLWRYRSLKSGFYTFDHEYIFIFQLL